MEPYVEHVNITVRNIDHTASFLQIAIPEFQIRHQGQAEHYRWCHIGTDGSYLALQEVVKREQVDRTPYLDIGLNHAGLVISDVDAARKRLLAAGYRENDIVAPHPWRKRIYFFDGDGIEWEFTQYLSEEPSQRNDYSL